MSTERKISLQVVKVQLPKILDQATFSGIKSVHPRLLQSEEIWFDFSQVVFVAKSFFPQLLAFRKEIEAANIYFKSVDLSLSVKNQFVENGTFPFLNSSPAAPMVSMNRGSLCVAFVQPFIDSTISVFQAQCRTKVSLATPYLKGLKHPEQPIYVVGSISVVSSVVFGTATLCFPKNTFLKVTEKIYGTTHLNLTPENEGAAAAILKMIFNGAESELKAAGNYQVQPSVPTVIKGNDLRIVQEGGTTTVLPFKSEMGEFHLEIQLVTKD